MSEKQVVRVVDTRLEANSENQVKYVVEEGANVVNYTPLVASSHSNQTTVFNLNNIADRTCRDSRMAVELSVQLTLNVTNGTDASLNAINADNFGFKQWPLNRCIQSVQHQINQASTTLQTARLIDGIARLNSFPLDADFYENTQADVIDSYSAATGSNLNPLSPYSTTLLGDGVFKPRTLNYTIVGGAAANVISPNTTKSVVILATLYEPLITPFNNISAKNRRGLYAITGELINIQWVSDIASHMFAYAPYLLTLNSAVADIALSPCRLDPIYLTPQESYFSEIPHGSVYPYTDYQQFTNDIGACAAGGQLTQVSSQVCNFTNVPNKILIYAKLADQYITMATPDKYLKISNLQATFDNGQPQLNNASTRQLYDISKRNGLCMPAACFQQFQLNSAAVPPGSAMYGCGSVVVLDPALDAGLRDGLSTASAGRYIFQFTCTLTNATGTNFPGCTLYAVGLNNGQLERIGSEYRNYLLTLPQDVLATAKQLTAVNHQMYVDAKHSNGFLSGGGVGDWFKKAFNVGKKGAKFALDHKDELEDAYNIGKKLIGGKKPKRDLFYE